MKQLKLFSRFNSSPDEMLAWLTAEQEAGRLYSRRELLRMPLETRKEVGAPDFSRSGLIYTLGFLVDQGLVVKSDSTHKKVIVVGVPLPIGSHCFLS